MTIWGKDSLLIHKIGFWYPFPNFAVHGCLKDKLGILMG
jgi:hypothetical protein